MMLMLFSWVVVVLVLYMMRPTSLRGSRQLEGKPNPVGDLFSSCSFKIFMRHGLFPLILGPATRPSTSPCPDVAATVVLFSSVN
jgi:Protein of unknown function (DUF2615)